MSRFDESGNLAPKLWGFGKNIISLISQKKNFDDFLHFLVPSYSKPNLPHHWTLIWNNPAATITSLADTQRMDCVRCVCLCLQWCVSTRIHNVPTGDTTGTVVHPTTGPPVANSSPACVLCHVAPVTVSVSQHSELYKNTVTHFSFKVRPCWHAIATPKPLSDIGTPWAKYGQSINLWLIKGPQAYAHAHRVFNPCYIVHRASMWDRYYWHSVTVVCDHDVRSLFHNTMMLEKDAVSDLQTMEGQLCISTLKSLKESHMVPQRPEAVVVSSRSRVTKWPCLVWRNKFVCRPCSSSGSISEYCPTIKNHQMMRKVSFIQTLYEVGSIDSSEITVVAFVHCFAVSLLFSDFGLNIEASLVHIALGTSALKHTHTYMLELYVVVLGSNRCGAVELGIEQTVY